MDGINGITGGYSFVIVSALWYINSFQLQFIDNQLLIILLLSILVFNFFNFRKKAKCFAGDVGAISIAFIIIFILGKLIIKTGDFSYIIMLAVYGVDSVLTILHRLILKENIFLPHRKHVFQILANELKYSHIAVSTFYALLQSVIIGGLFLFKNHSITYMITIIILLSISYLLFKIKYFKLHTL